MLGNMNSTDRLFLLQKAHTWLYNELFATYICLYFSTDSVIIITRIMIPITAPVMASTFTITSTESENGFHCPQMGLQ